MKNEQIDRLLRSAAQADEEVPAAMPFGFDTRVVALWRAGTPKGERRDAAASTRGRVVDSRNRHINNRGNSRSKSEPRNPRIVRK